MKRFILLVFLIASSMQAKVAVPQTAFLVDAIQAVVFGQEEPQIIAFSDVVRPSLSGAPRTLDELIFERLVYGNALQFKIMSDDDAVDKYLAMIQKQNNLTLDELKNVFAAAGYSYEEGREQFKLLQTVNTMLDFKVRSQVVVPRKQVEQYYLDHPQITEAKVLAQRGFIPYAQEDKRELQKKALAYMAHTGKEVRGMQWDEPVNLAESEVADEKAFLFALKKGEISPAHDVGIGFEVFRAVDVSPRVTATIEEQYKDIVNTLSKPIYEELYEKYKKSLMDAASILYLQPITGAEEEMVPTEGEQVAPAA